MVIKRLQSRLLGRNPAMFRLFYGSFLFFLLVDLTTMFMGFRRLWSYDEFDPYGYLDGPMQMMMIEATLILSITPALAANAFSKEHGLGNMDKPRMSLLTPWDILSRKLFAGVISVFPVVLGAMLESVISGLEALLEPGGISFLFTFWVTLVEWTLLSLTIGLFASVTTRSTAVSMGLSYGLNFMVFVGLPLIVPYVGRPLIVDFALRNARTLGEYRTGREGREGGFGVCRNRGLSDSGFFQQRAQPLCCSFRPGQFVRHTFLVLGHNGVRNYHLGHGWAFR